MRIKHKKSDKEIFKAIWQYYNASDYLTGNSSNMSMILNTMENSLETVYFLKTHSGVSNNDDYIISVAYKAANISDITEVRQIIFNKLSSKERDILNIIFYQSPGKFSLHLREKYKLLYYDKYIDLTALGFQASICSTIELFEVTKISSKQIEDAKSVFFEIVNKIIYYYKEYEKNENR